MLWGMDVLRLVKDDVKGQDLRNEILPYIDAGFILLFTLPLRSQLCLIRSCLQWVD